MREALDRGLVRLRKESEARPELRNAILLTSGRVMMKRGAYSAAEELVRGLCRC